MYDVTRYMFSYVVSLIADVILGVCAFYTVPEPYTWLAIAGLLLHMVSGIIRLYDCALLLRELEPKKKKSRKKQQQHSRAGVILETLIIDGVAFLVFYILYSNGYPAPIWLFSLVMVNVTVIAYVVLNK